jgi:hypothetical protein
MSPKHRGDLSRDQRTAEHLRTPPPKTLTESERNCHPDRSGGTCGLPPAHRSTRCSRSATCFESEDGNQTSAIPPNLAT